MSAARTYKKVVHDRIGEYWATWLPGDLIRVGDCGPLNGITFKNVDTLAHYQISFEAEPGRKWTKLDCSSSSGVEHSGSAAASAIVGQAEFAVKFTRENSVLFAAADVEGQSLRNRGDILRQLKQKNFPSDHAVVSDVLVAKSLTVMVAGKTKETVILHLAVPVGTPIGPAEIASAVGHSGGASLEFAIVGNANMTPLYKLVWPPRGFWRTLQAGFVDFLSRFTFGSVGVEDDVVYVDFDAAYAGSEGEDE